MCGAAFHTGAAGYKFGPNNYFYWIICGQAKWCTIVTANTAGNNIMCFTFIKCGNYIRRCTACSNANNHIFIINLVALQIYPALLRIIFGKFNRFGNGFCATRNYSNYQTIIYTKSWGAFAGIYNTQSATGAGTNIKQAATNQHLIYNHLYKYFNFRNYFFNGCRHCTVFFIDVG